MRRTNRSCLALALIGLCVVFPATTLSAQIARFQRGDANTDGRLDLSDPIFSLSMLFLGGRRTSCEDAADSNDDGNLDLTDAIYSLRHLFQGGSEPPAPGLACGSDPTSDDLGCQLYFSCAEGEPVLGQSEFESPLGFSPFGGFAEEDGRDRGGPDVAAPGAEEESESPGRILEEADLYKLVGGHLFVLNRYRGLYVIDVSDLDRPEVVGRAPIFGYPREMYVRGNTAYVLVTDFYSFSVDETSGLARGSYGSQVRIVDISDARKPVVLSSIDLDGYLTDSRIVGDVLYLVSQYRPCSSFTGSGTPEPVTTVVSLELGDPQEVQRIDVQEFPLNGWQHHLHVTRDAIFLSSTGYVGDRGYETRLRYIDISDPGGTILVRGESTVPGQVRDRWSLDEEEGVLRVASGQTWGNGDIYLSTYSVEDPDNLAELGRYTLHIRERLTSARFDGSRGYLVSYRNVDPLYVFDLSDPARPALLGELEMSGWLDFMIPMGDRIVALGREDETLPEGGSIFSLAVSLIDVSLETPPELLSRVTLDGLWASVPSSRDDFAKVFRVVPEEGLVLFPFRAWDHRTYRYAGGVQLIDYDESRLTRRGVIDGGGRVERGIPLENDTVLTLSTQAFQSVDIRNRDEPRIRGELELARNVQDFAFLGDEHTLQFSGDWYRGDTKLTVTPIDAPDTTTPLSELAVPARHGRMFTNGDLAYVASQDLVVTDETWRYESQVRVVDLSDPLAPVERGSVTLPEGVTPGYRYWYWGYGDQVAQVNGSTLAFHRFRYYYRCLGCVEDDEDSDAWNRIFLVDLSNPDEPRLSATIVLDDANWVWGFEARGSMLLFSSYVVEQRDDIWVARYFLRRFDLSDPSKPVELPAVNIPGMFVDASPELDVIYTLENRWDSTTYLYHTFLYALQLSGDRASFLSRVEIDGWLNSIEIDGQVAVGSVYRWWYEDVDGDRSWRSSTNLVAVDLSDPTDLRLASDTQVPVNYAYLRKFTDGRAFVGSWPGMLVYSFEDIDEPSFERFFRTQGWVQDILLREDLAYLPSGYYGVQVLDLASEK